MDKISGIGSFIHLQASLWSVGKNQTIVKAIDEAVEILRTPDIVDVTPNTTVAQPIEELSAIRKLQLDNGAAPNTLSDLVYLSSKEAKT